MDKIYNITVEDTTKRYHEGALINDVANDYKEKHDYPIILSLYNNRLKELTHPLTEDGTIELLDTRSKDARKAYRRSVVLMLQKAVYDIYEDYAYDVRVIRSIDNGYFCQVNKVLDDKTSEIVEADEKLVSELDYKMHGLVSHDVPIEKVVMKTKEAMRMFHERKMYDKETLLKYRTSSNINIYKIDKCYDYFYGFMAPSCGCLGDFKLTLFNEGFVLQFPERFTQEIHDFEPSMKYCQELQKSAAWSHAMKIETVGDLNDRIALGQGKEVILINEALQEKYIGDIARKIYDDRSKKFIMIAGPSSSGKTTFSHKLSTQLKGLGMMPHPIPLDDYYVDRDEVPLDEFGKKDFECIEALDVELFNHDMLALLNGERVLLPTFNFKSGKREYQDHYMQLGDADVLVIEGIHGLNDKLSHSLPRESKYKIYISALTPLSIDEHNPLSTADCRLIRRIVRDARTRGTTAEGTLAMWDSVRRGETKNIFTFQEEADFIINSALIYEMSVLKVYALPQLYAVSSDSSYFAEANRLIKLLEYFLPLPGDDIPNTSIVREFIGGGAYLV